MLVRLQLSWTLVSNKNTCYYHIPCSYASLMVAIYNSNFPRMKCGVWLSQTWNLGGGGGFIYPIAHVEDPITPGILK